MFFLFSLFLGPLEAGSRTNEYSRTRVLIPPSRGLPALRVVVEPRNKVVARCALDAWPLPLSPLPLPRPAECTPLAIAAAAPLKIMLHGES